MRISLIVGMLVMPTMNGNPARRRVLQTKNGEHDKEMLQRLSTSKPAMRKQAMVAKVDTQDPGKLRGGNGENQSAPIEKPGQKRGNCRQVIADDENDLRPVRLERGHTERKWQFEAARSSFLRSRGRRS